MVSLREYLLAVHNLEMKIHTEESILPHWIRFQKENEKKLRAKIIEPKEMALNNTMNIVHDKPQELPQLNARLKDLEKELETVEKNTIKTNSSRKKSTIGDFFLVLVGVPMLSAIIVFLLGLFFSFNSFTTPFIVVSGIIFILCLRGLFSDSRKETNKANQVAEEKQREIQQEIAKTKERIDYLSASYETEVATLNKKIAIYKQDLEDAQKRYNQEITPIAQKIETLKLIIQLDRAQLQELYNANIIHPKYRGLIPVSMFYDYVDTGRCSTLTGHEGAYNIYESELRDQIIFDTLGKINNNISDMKKSMYFFATRMEASLQTINRSMITSADQINGSFAALNANYSSLKSSTDGILKQLENGITLKIEYPNNTP